MNRSRADEGLSIGPWEVLPRLNVLRGHDAEVHIEPRYMDLLVYLAERAGEVVSTDEILGRVWHGQVVGDHSVYQAIARLRKALGDGAGERTYIETVPKRGYRLIAAVDRGSRPTAPSPTTKAHGSVPWKGLLLVVAGVALALYLAVQTEQSETTNEATTTIAVLPFRSLSEQENDAQIAAGFAIELADALGRLEHVSVIGPVSSSLAGAPHTARQRDLLQADIVVDGSLRRDGSTLRVAVALSDASDGRQLLSRISDHADNDVFAAQRRMAATLADAIRGRQGLPPVAEVDATPHDVQAYDFYLLGRYHRARRDPQSLHRAAAFFRDALAREPDFTAARVALATTILLSSYYDQMALDEAVAQATPLLEHVLQESPADADLLAAIGLSHYLRGSYGVAADYLQRAIAVDVNNAEAWMWLGLAQRQQGDLRSAEAAFARVRVIEPLFTTAALNHANALSWMGDSGAADALLSALLDKVGDDAQLYRGRAEIALDHGDLAAAYRWSQRALAIDPQTPLSRANLAMVLAYLGRTADAARMVDGLHPASRAVQRYLDRLSATVLGLPDRDAATESLQTPPRANGAEIDWRLTHARAGMQRYLAGDMDVAHKQLDMALEGRIYPIERTDYDLLLCSMLVDAQERVGHRDEAVRWRERCGAELERSRRNGWQTLAAGYVGARLAMQDGHADAAREQLAKLVEKGFRNRRLLRADPLFSRLHGDAAFSELLDRLDATIDAEWQAAQSPSI